MTWCVTLRCRRRMATHVQCGLKGRRRPSLRPSAKFNSLFHENTRDLPRLMFRDGDHSLSGLAQSFSALRFAAQCALHVVLLVPSSLSHAPFVNLSFSQQCCWHDGAVIFIVNGMILHAGYFFPEAVGLLVFCQILRVPCAVFSFACAGMGKSPSLTLVLGREEREMKTLHKVIRCYGFPLR